jgi:hypothetical protein
MLVEAARANSERLWRWGANFHFGRDYVLIPPAEISQVRKCVGAFQEHRWIAACGPYINLRDVRVLAIPVFNAGHSRALVSEIRLFSDSERLRMYQRTGNSWKVDEAALAACEWSFVIP